VAGQRRLGGAQGRRLERAAGRDVRRPSACAGGELGAQGPRSLAAQELV
jgi:hypothetical protein